MEPLFVMMLVLLVTVAVMSAVVAAVSAIFYLVDRSAATREGRAQEKRYDNICRVRVWSDLENPREVRWDWPAGALRIIEDVPRRPYHINICADVKPDEPLWLEKKFVGVARYGALIVPVMSVEVHVRSFTDVKILDWH